MIKAQKISVDLRIVTIALLVVVMGMLIAWKPWNNSNVAGRSIEVNGKATIEAEPDEFQFSPTYQKKGADRAAIQKELTDQVNTVVTKLKELGVQESDISLSSSTYDNFWEEDGQQVTSNTLTITVKDKELTQKVQDYLLSTAPTGQVSPYATFSKDKQKTVEEEARSAALADAKERAQRTAEELDAKVGKVLNIVDQQSGGIIYPMYGRDMMMTAESEASSLPVLPGKQDIEYTITVTYEIK